MDIKQELIIYSNTIKSFKAEETKKLNQSSLETRLNTSNPYFQLLLMSEVCDALIVLLEINMMQDFFTKYNLRMNDENSLQHIIDTIMQKEDGYKKMKPLLPMRYLGIGAVWGAFTLYAMLYWIAAINALPLFTLFTLFSALYSTVVLLLLFQMMMIYLIQANKLNNALDLIQAVYQNNGVSYSKQFKSTQGEKIGTPYTAYSLYQGFFNRAADASLDLGLSDQISEGYFDGYFEERCKLALFRQGPT